MKNSKTYLKLLIVVGLVAVVGGGAGTFASFNATTTNANTFATGTLVLSNKVGSTACLSTGGTLASPTAIAQSNANSSCDALFTAALSQPSNTVYTANLTLKNEGTLNSSTLALTPTCVGAANSATTPFTGSANLCDAIEVTVAETDSLFTTVSTCVYGGASCALDATKTLSGLQTTAPSITGGITAGSSRYFQIKVEFPNTVADQNQYQGRTATLSMGWKIAQ